MRREIQIKQFPIVTTHWWPKTRNERFVWENEQYLYRFLPLVHNHVQVIWVRTRIRCVTCVRALWLTPHSHGASASTPLVDFEWSDVKRCRTELWVRRVASLALLTAEVENFSTFQAPTEASIRSPYANTLAQTLANPVHATPEKYVIGCCHYDSTSAPSFRHALRQALTPTPRVNGALVCASAGKRQKWSLAQTKPECAHTRHTLDACAHSDHLDMVVYKR